VRSGDVTFDEFCVVVHDGEKADLIDGVIYMASPDNTHAASLQVWLQALLYEFIDIYKLGLLFTSRVAYKISEKNSPEPDLAFLSNDRKDSIKRGRVEGPPTLAIEIVSPDSVHRDYVQKRELYEKSGVREYWIIDPDEERATFLVRKGNRFVEGKPQKHFWHSLVLPGFILDVRWLWLDEFPSIFSILRDHYYPKQT
jgi:Uma2 family endonuclease